MIAFIDDHRGVYGGEPICRVLPIAPSTYHAHAARRAYSTRLPAQAQPDLALTADSGRTLNPIGRLIVKRHAETAGLDPRDFAGHSLRAGFLTSAAGAGADVLRMMEVSRHKRVETVQGYVRRGNGFKGHAGSDFL